MMSELLRFFSYSKITKWGGGEVKDFFMAFFKRQNESSFLFKSKEKLKVLALVMK